MNESDEQLDEQALGAPLTHNKADDQSPGEILREARLAHDYSVEDLCAQTKLSRKSIRALEDNDFGALSQPVFARGYYRQCAKILDIDQERLMAAYTAWAGESERRQDPESAVSVVPEDVTQQQRSVYMLVAVVVALLLLAFVGLFMFDSGGNETTDTTAGTAVPSESPSGGTRSAGTSTSVDQSAQGAGDGAMSSQDDLADAAGAQSRGGRNVNDTLGIEPPDDNGEDDKPVEPSIAANHLKMTFTGRSWVDVRDSTDKRLLTGIYESGDEREFDGEPPYKITLGFAPAVQMSIGGEPVDVESHTTSGSTARMTVEARDDN